MAAPKTRGGRMPRNREIKEYKPSPIHLLWMKQWVYKSMSQTEIAEDHFRRTGQTVSRQSVCNAVHKCEEWMRQHEIVSIQNMRQKISMQLDRVQREMIEAYEKSIGKVVTKTVKETPEGNEITTRIEISRGDVAYIGKYLDAIRSKREILGLDCPTKTEVTHIHAEEIEGLDNPQGMTRAEALRQASQKILEIAEREEKRLAASQIETTATVIE